MNITIANNQATVRTAQIDQIVEEILPKIPYPVLAIELNIQPKRMKRETRNQRTARTLGTITEGG